ncbi:MAG: hypothetical protein JNJ40_14050 [Bacteroidia bacterium]|nr:hypothetical protein [Bacteroidia bacterium]
MFFIKYYGVNYSTYQYDKGFRFNYLLKYNFINRKRFRISVNASFAYKHIYFNNKPSSLFVSFSDNPKEAEPPPLFSMNRSLKGYGPGAGFTFNYNISKHLSVGSYMQFEYLNQQRYYQVNDPEKFYEYYPEYLYFLPEYTREMS